MFNSNKVLVFLFAAFYLLGSAGCARQIKAEYKHYKVVREYPKTGQLHPNRWARYPKDRPGPHLLVYITTEAGFEENAKAWTDHLYYELLPCSQQDNAYDLWTGSVYSTTAEESAQMGLDGRSKELIKIIVPLDLNSLAVSVRADGLMDVTQYLEQARTDGMCVRVGGGKPSGLGLMSNMIRIPARIEDDAIVIDAQQDPGGATLSGN